MNIYQTKTVNEKVNTAKKASLEMKSLLQKLMIDQKSPALVEKHIQ